MDQIEIVDENREAAAMIQPRFVDRETVKQFLPVSDTTLWRLRRDSIIESRRINGRVLFGLDSVIAYVENSPR